MSQEVGKVRSKSGSLNYEKYPIGSSLWLYPYHVSLFWVRFELLLTLAFCCSLVRLPIIILGILFVKVKWLLMNGFLTEDGSESRVFALGSL